MQITLDQGVSLSASVISIGSEAARFFERDQPGRVLAVFDRSFYVQSKQDVVCIGVASLGQGPLNVLLATEKASMPFEVARGSEISIKLESSPEIAGARSAERVEPFFGAVSGSAIFALSASRLSELLTLAVPPKQAGFAWMIGSTDWQNEEYSSLESRVAGSALERGLMRQCLPALRSLHRWLGLAFAVEASNKHLVQSSGQNCQCLDSSALALLGAGQGLTPSGDDLLAGVMLALHRLQRVDLSDALWRVLEPQLSHRTNLISGAHLRMAARGQCSEPILSLLESLLVEQDCQHSETAQASALKIRCMASRVGSSSGWDTLAGMSLVLLAL